MVKKVKNKEVGNKKVGKKVKKVVKLTDKGVIINHYLKKMKKKV